MEGKEAALVSLVVLMDRRKFTNGLLQVESSRIGSISGKPGQALDALCAYVLSQVPAVTLAKRADVIDLIRCAVDELQKETEAWIEHGPKWNAKSQDGAKIAALTLGMTVSGSTLSAKEIAAQFLDGPAEAPRMLTDSRAKHASAFLSHFIASVERSTSSESDNVVRRSLGTLYPHRLNEFRDVLSYLQNGRNVLIWGKSGMGKSTLAQHVTRFLRTERQETVIQLDLRTGAEQVSSDVAVDNIASAILRNRRINPNDIPHESRLSASIQELYSSEAVLLVDNVQRAKHVEPFLSSTSPLLITAVDSIPHLGIERVKLDSLTAQYGGRLFSEQCKRVAKHDDLEVHKKINDICDGNPQLLLVAGGLCSGYESAQDFVVKVERRKSLLLETAAGIYGDHVIFGEALSLCSNEALDVLFVLAACNWASFSLPCVRDAVPGPVAQLHRFVLIEQRNVDYPNRYFVHDLLRTFLHENQERFDYEGAFASRSAALAAIADEYLEQARFHLNRVEPGRPRHFDPLNIPPASYDVRFTGSPVDIEESETWFETDRDALVALIVHLHQQACDEASGDKEAARRLHRLVVDLASCIPTYFIIRGLWVSWVEPIEAAIDSARCLDDAARLAFVLQTATNVYRTAGKWPRSGDCIMEAWDLLPALGDPPFVKAYFAIDLALSNVYGVIEPTDRNASHQRAIALIEDSIRVFDGKSERWYAHAVRVRAELVRSGTPSQQDIADYRTAAIKFEGVGDARWAAYSRSEHAVGILRRVQEPSGHEDTLEELHSALAEVDRLGDIKWATVIRLRAVSTLCVLRYSDHNEVKVLLDAAVTGMAVVKEENWVLFFEATRVLYGVLTSVVDIEQARTLLKSIAQALPDRSESVWWIEIADKL